MFANGSPTVIHPYAESTCGRAATVNASARKARSADIRARARQSNILRREQKLERWQWETREDEKQCRSIFMRFFLSAPLACRWRRGPRRRVLAVQGRGESGNG
jgi:hypothetical protein